MLVEARQLRRIPAPGDVDEVFQRSFSTQPAAPRSRPKFWQHRNVIADKHLGLELGFTYRKSKKPDKLREPFRTQSGHGDVARGLLADRVRY